MAIDPLIVPFFQLTGNSAHREQFRSDSSEQQSTTLDEEEVNTQNQTFDYLSLEPERIVSITRSRSPGQNLEFLLKCTRCPNKLFFISHGKAKELIPDLVIDFYERHINWFLDKPAGQPSYSTKRRNTRSSKS